jgi:hypothetical protein
MTNALLDVAFGIDSPAPAGYAPYRLVFQNPGLVDMTAVKTFGVNAKDTENPIGYFGTGLKYAIAIILRTGGRFMIFRGLERFEFTVRETEIRGKKFNIVHCNDEALSFTTEIGKNWKPWMALRELYCNTVDEKGSVIAQEAEPPVEADVTKMIVVGEEWGRIWEQERGSFILATTPLATSTYADVHPGETQHLYYKGIRAYTAQKPFMYTYNLKSWCELTEDRSIAWEWQAKDHIYRACLKLENKTVLRRLFAQISQDEKEHYAEFDFSYPEGYEMSAEARAVIKELWAAKDLAHHRGLGHYREIAVLDDIKDEELTLTEAELATVNAVNALLQGCGLPPHFHQMVVTEQLTSDSGYYVTKKPWGIGFALRDRALTLEVRSEQETLFISRGIIMQGVEKTLKTVFEAWIDKSYDAKQALPRVYAKTLMALRDYAPQWDLPPDTPEVTL